MNEAKRQAWNAAAATGDEDEIRRLQDVHLTEIATRHMDEVLWEDELR